MPVIWNWVMKVKIMVKLFMVCFVDSRCTVRWPKVHHDEVMVQHAAPR